MTNNRIKIRQCVKKGYIEMDSGGVADLSYPSSKLRRGRVQEDGWICPTLTCNSGVHKIVKEIDEMGKIRYGIRRLTPTECFVLMGMEKKDVGRCTRWGMSESALYKQAGNAIVTNCIKLMFMRVYKRQTDVNYKSEDEIKQEEKMLREKFKNMAQYQQISLDDLDLL